MKKGILTWITHGFSKMRSDYVPNEAFSNEYTVYMAKGETEGCQIALRSEAPLSAFSLSYVAMSENCPSVEIFSMQKTHPINSLLYTDSTIEYDGSNMALGAEQTVPFLVEFTAPRDIEAGDYSFEFELKNESELISVYKVNVHVWNFELPTQKSFATSVGIYDWHLVEQYGYCDEELYKQYYDKLLEHGLSAFNLPYDVLDDRADSYMSNPAVTSFMLPHEADDETLSKIYAKLKTNPSWLKKAMFYPFDEPREIEHLQFLKDVCARLKRICPEVKISSAFYLDLQTGEGTDQVDHMSEYIDRWCPKLCMWNDEMAYNLLDYKPKPFSERMSDMKARGDEMWCYVCNDPVDPYIAYFIDVCGLYQRVLFWQNYQRNIDGFLYWSSNAWGYHGYETDPWKDPYNGVKDGVGNPVYGEGFLFYPGNKIGVNRPITSIRLKIMRDGIEDYELLRLASKYLGEDKIQSIINDVTPSLTTVKVSEDGFINKRIEIGNLLEKALCNGENYEI